MSRAGLDISIEQVIVWIVHSDRVGEDKQKRVKEKGQFNSQTKQIHQADIIAKTFTNNLLTIRRYHKQNGPCPKVQQRMWHMDTDGFGQELIPSFVFLSKCT